MHRTDVRPYPGKAVLTGQLSPDGKSIVNGKIQWTYHPCCGLSTGRFQAAWGSAIDTVPGTDGSRKPEAPQQTGNVARPARLIPRMSEPTPAIATLRLDLNEDWNGYYDSPALVETIRITQDERDIKAEELNSANMSATGRIFFQGIYASPASHVQIMLAIYQGVFGLLGQPQSWENAELVIGDPDHFRIGNHPPFVRINSAKVGDVSCDSSNRYNTTGLGAFPRGGQQLREKNYEQAICWYYVGANQGYREAISQLGYMYSNGSARRRRNGAALVHRRRRARKLCGCPQCIGALRIGSRRSEGSRKS